ncbi:MAG: hypothetical protein JNM51_07870 [Bacteroidia bacterium]|nr:hypothetical protein [Bacteroidia bacterium]
MENPERNSIRKSIGKVASSFLLLFILIALGVSLYYNKTLQEQVNKRDIIIEKLTQDSILNEIMNIKYDSISKSTSYSYRTRNGKLLKYDELANELDKSRGDYKLGRNELITEYNSLVNRYNKLVENNAKINSNFNQVADSLYSNKIVLKLIQSNYHVDFSIDRYENGNIKKVSINADQLDSALVLLPYFRNRLTLEKVDENKKFWSIKINTK